MKTLLYYFFKLFVKTGLFFYSKKITVVGSERIPKNEAVIFTANHPNGLIDPLLIATHIKRRTNFLVRAAVFNNPIIAKFFNLLGMMPIYRIRDGVQQLSKNEEIFNKCQLILKNNKILLIFPEGTHNKDRTVRPLSKGFTRIIFKTLDNFPDTKINIVPVGITYQNISSYPSKTAIYFGFPILANNYYDKQNINQSVKNIKELVSNQLEDLSVHIKQDEGYETTLSTLNNAQVDFTKVNYVNTLIKDKKVLPQKKRSINYALPLFLLIVLNSLIPYSIWKFLSKKVDEIEFIDTFRFGVNAILFPLFYCIQSWIINIFFGWKIALLYFFTSFLLILLYTKLSTTPPSK
ncbi:lysophospholipid acyltransferase family protein [Tenacibaculum larymnensis]|uniref:Lysophospholipid acyltransferase family protein n=1 Tax=Tenacibaculum larymnensis TaxID=2878201 RepID=A0A9X4ER02_9FLAO|nr:lysophospholipid acyltransferase family protein [Tenacibaculum larymnensis]MDE1207332.1 lysophospholipid acyltransferase family protein [Tenacibaculum larymnensis]